ncbi:GNAT family N-acetyltransferase [Pseudomonas gingeri]|uniref:GNAT family N-acetyltransferase n=1 Tax=Pseudomonas gingeri TaxID=117681 RepID=UPI0015A48E1D|nr:GNAT family N-acetyltransferase [Pseudomonas gingeri]NWA09453.1 GNAT family N-acetyltransferase [Pseudomonas gingeri]
MSELDPLSLPAPDFPSVAGEHWIETLRDGSHVLIRPLRPEDRERERAFIKRLSPQSRHQRFLGEIVEPGTLLLNQLMNTDERNRVAYIALVHDNGELREVGISRYAATGNEQACESAITVADDWQHRGLGTALMKHLIDSARRHHFTRMYSIDSAANSHMRDLARDLGFTRERDPDDATQVIHQLLLTP